MRSELTILEQIDLYLSGKLPPAEQTAFESKISSDPALASKVNQQKELIRAAKRKALRAQINTVAAGAAGGGAGGMSNLFLGATGLAVAGIITATVIYFNRDTPTVSNEPLVENRVITPVMDSMENVTYELEEEALTIEAPETIFSTLNSYENEDNLEEGDQMNVMVHFQPREDRAIIAPSESAEGEMYSEVDNRKAVEMPEIEQSEAVNLTKRALFPGGNSALKGFIDKNLRYPKSAKDKNIEGIVRCNFHVTRDGLITEIKAECIVMNGENEEPFSEMRRLMNKKIANAFINNATHILRTMPTWEPAKNSNGNPILSEQKMYFNYDMERGCLVYQLDD